MAKARAEANKVANAILEKAKVEEAKIIHSARDAAKAKTQEVLNAVQSERAKIAIELDREVEPLAGKIVEVVLR
jgi:hypothetical protein